MDTTGAIVICKNDMAHQSLADQLKEHSITRKYRALVHGNLKEDALIWKAIELYCKAQADYEGKGQQYQTAYNNLRDSLALCGDYKRTSI